MVSSDPVSRPVVTVCGTVNVDTFVTVGRFPTAGETVIAEPVGVVPGSSADGAHGNLGTPVNLGGKGANQAVAAARFAGTGPEGHGTAVRLFATVGADDRGTGALGVLAGHGVDVSRVAVCAEAPTGSAFIMNDAEGENIIVVVSGANTSTDPAAFISRSGDDTGVGSGGILLAQGELTPEHSTALPELARSLGARFILNLAPVTVRGEALCGLVATADPLIVNESEAADVLGVARDTGLDEVLDALTAAVGRGLARSAVVTLGAQGALVIDPAVNGPMMVPSPAADPVVDTTGAGDAFCGTLAAALAEGFPLHEAVRYAAAAGSLAVESAGAAASYAGRAEVHRRADG
ncbi:ribokinase [uncultured Corynebacterium sp.]|uniref:ribokinase n=1 Tax=uncultured Corynebacterium sp. TaxID=159447 RepID=UPI0025F6D86A|nr:ribokinase [uncultured Corynebacterium sp.]